MARANGNGGGKHRRADDEKPDPERTQRTKPVQEVVDELLDDRSDSDRSGGGR